MNVTTAQNTPVVINFQELVNTRSWVLSGNKAIHYPCNNNTMLRLLSYEIQPNTEYTVSFKINAMNTSPLLGVGFDTPIQTYTTAQDVNLTISTTQTGKRLTFWGTGYIELEVINLQAEAEPVYTNSRENIIWDEDQNRWVDFRSYRPESGFSMFTDLFTWRAGQLWMHSREATPNNFYGQQYQTTIKFPVGKGYVKNWQSIAIHSNIIMATTTDGITTPLGQVSDLVEEDFTTREGIHYANFLRDKLTDIIEGDRLKGRYISIELTTIDGSKRLQLFKVTAKFMPSTPNE